METQKVSELNLINEINPNDSIPVLTDEIDNGVERVSIELLSSFVVENNLNITRIYED